MSITELHTNGSRVLVTYNAAKVDDDIRARVNFIQGNIVAFTEYSASCAFPVMEHTMTVDDFLFHYRPVRSGGRSTGSE